MSLTEGVGARVLDGPHIWGRMHVRPVSRTLWSARSLVVFPPGTNRRERLLLRAWHSWILVGAVLAVGIMAVTTPTPVPGMTVAGVVYAAGFVVLAWTTRRLRRHVHTLTVTTYHGNGRPEVHGDVRLLAASVETLSVLEDALRRRRIAPVDFEAVWADVWRAIPSRR